jgi:hypothetical protein
MKLKILEGRGLRIFSADSNGGASFIVLSLLTLTKEKRMNRKKMMRRVREDLKAKHLWSSSRGGGGCRRSKHSSGEERIGRIRSGGHHLH